MKLKPGPKGPHKHPSLIKSAFNTRLPNWLQTEVENSENRVDNISVTTEKALIQYLNIKKPSIP